MSRYAAGRDCPQNAGFSPTASGSAGCSPRCGTLCPGRVGHPVLAPHDGAVRSAAPPEILRGRSRTGSRQRSVTGPANSSKLGHGRTPSTSSLLSMCFARSGQDMR